MEYIARFYKLRNLRIWMRRHCKSGSYDLDNIQRDVIQHYRKTGETFYNPPIECTKDGEEASCPFIVMEEQIDSETIEQVFIF